MNIVGIVFVILSWKYVSDSQMNICLNKRKICPPTQLCVTWDRACSIGANCIQSSIQIQPTFECLPTPVRKPMIPTKQLCGENEVWARGVQKLCRVPPCPLWWGYACYTKSYKTESCERSKVKCDFGKVCVMTEYCNQYYCEPKPSCQVM